MEEPQGRLESWKEIAAFLNCSERTAKRWEKTRQLPIRRLPGGAGGVFAYRQDVVVWRNGEGSAPETQIGVVYRADLPSELRETSPAKLAKMSYLWLAIAGSIVLLLIGWVAPHAVGSRKLIAAKATRHIPPQEAKDLYLRGRFYWNKRTPTDLQHAMSDFEAASSLDPNYAEPLAGIADVYALAPQFASIPPVDAFPKMLDYARRALALNPNLPEGHRAMAFALFYWDWDRVASKREFERALELNPQDATALHWYANVLQQSQNISGALPLIEKARELEPTDRSILSDRASILAYLGHKTEADEAWDAIEASEPTYLPPHLHRSEVAKHDGNAEVYLGELRAIAAITQSPADFSRWRLSSAAYRRGGWAALLNVAADLDMKFAREHGFGYVTAAFSLDQASRDAESLQFVEIAYQHRDPAFPLISAPDHFFHLQGLARFKDLRSRSLMPYTDAAPDARPL